MFLGLSAAARAKLTAIPREQTLDEATLTQLLDGPALRLGPKQQEQVREALALAAYLADPDWPVVRTLVCELAPTKEGMRPSSARSPRNWRSAGSTRGGTSRS